ncbi:c-type cytochrome [Neolewinella aurantiaca]|uniref:C-type cytochrome n=1 Tax=Neolewinella aurantiaca TaxID=2602767 RepID=A0A5C7G082_9BACT|nr:cbb3-type cytochrome c oxidase N-terminal domain-containing protein [Neolewinella aurantiaca]TXF91036.1 c-type cytochrome [Neolewinella aurantiaca]
MNFLTNNPLFLQATAPVVEPAPTGLLTGMSPMEQLLLVLMLLVFAAGMGAVINLSFVFMRMQRLRMLEKYHPEVLEKVGVPVPASATIPWWKQLYDRLTDEVPVEMEEEILLDHNYDGIMELDNNLPPWWKGLFYIAIAFAPVYIYFNHFSDYGLSSHEAYEVQMDQAADDVKAYLATQKNAIDESNVTLLVDADALSNGQTLFTAKCAVCHGQLAEGGIGPNLTDAYWLHGGSIADIFKTIKYGVPEKGMIAWKSELRPRDMQEVASFITSMGGTEPANAKEPQGELYEPREEEEVETTTE